MSEIFKAVNESLSMVDVARHFGYASNRAGFIKSPFKEERTASCKLYTRSFYDFSSGTGGDIIRFCYPLPNEFLNRQRFRLHKLHR